MGDTDFLNETTKDLNKDTLKTVSLLCNTLKDKRKEISLLEEQLKNLKNAEKKLSQEEIPNFFLSVGLDALSLDTGEKISLKESIYVTLPKNPQKRTEVLKWLVGNGGADIIKRQVEIEEPDDGVLVFLRDNSIAFSDKKSVHAGTLKAWFRSKLGISKGSLQEIEVGDVPIEANLFLYKETIIK